MAHTAPITRRALTALAASCAAAGLTGCDALSTSGEDGTSWPILTDRPKKQQPAGSAEAAESQQDERTVEERLLDTMTLEQKVAQLFIVTPEELTGVRTAIVAGDVTAGALEVIPVGGLIYFAKNLVSAQQVRDLLAGTHDFAMQAGAGIPPFLSVDEEGGTLVARVAKSGLFDVPTFPNMAEVGATGDPTRAAEVGEAIGTYLHEIGFNLDFAPDADVLTNPENTAIGRRSFGSDPELVASMVSAEVEAMLETGTLPCVKHFPGHGDTTGDSHTGAVYAERSREEIESCEFAPFRAAIEAGCPMVMVGHIETPNFANDGLPASLSPTMITDVLRGELGFKGVVTTDSFSMGAITQNFHPADAAVRYIQAGGDILLMPASLRDAYDGILVAVQGGTIPEERIDESVLRILAAKRAAGLIG